MKKQLFKTVFAAVCLIGGMALSPFEAKAQTSYNFTYTKGATVAEGGDYFLYNIGTKQFLTSGLNYGTRATIDNSGRVLTLSTNGSGYNIYTNFVSLNNRNEDTRKAGYLTTNGYVDTGTSDAAWVFTPVNVDGYTNAYTIKNSDSQYLFFDVDNTDPGCLVSVGNNTGNNYSYWLLIPKTTREGAGDYSQYLINTQMNAPWEYKTWGGSTGWNDNAVVTPGGLISNRCGEKYHVSKDIYQEIKETVPNGRYKLYAQGFYRQDDNKSETAPVLYANSSTQELAVYNANGENTAATMDGASTSFTNGLYVNAVETFVNDGSLKVGINITGSYQWVCFDNFTLTYLGQIIKDYAEALPSSATANNWYWIIIPSDGEYTISSSAAATVTYTYDGNQQKDNASTVSSVTISTNGGEQTLTLTAGKLYLKSSAASTLQIAKTAEPVITDGTYFFKTDEGKFWMRGEPYGSAVQVYDWGMPVKVTTDALGATTLKFADASDWKIFSDKTGIYADNASPAYGTWNIIQSGTKYIFKVAVDNNQYHYMKVDGDRILSTATESEATAFTLVTPAEHQTVLTAYVNAQASAAATAASLSATTPAALQTAISEMNATSVIEGSTAATTAEKWQGGQWDSRTVYSNTVNVTVPGLYKFTLQGFYRMTDNATTYALHTAQTDCPPVYVFFGDAKTPIKSVMDESRATAYTGDNCDYAQDDNHYPNQQASSLVAFQEGKYTNTVWAYIDAAGEYTYGIQYLGWAGLHSEWTCYTTESISLTLYSQDWWGPLQAALTTYAPYNDVAEADDATGYTTAYNTFTAYTQSTPQSDMLAAITYLQNNYPDYQWAHASIAHPVDVTEGIINGWECTSNDAWPGSGRSTETGTYYDGTSRTYFTQNVEPNAARSQDVTIRNKGAYLLRTVVRIVNDNSYAEIQVGDEKTRITENIGTAANAGIGYGWVYNDVFFATTTNDETKTIKINMSHCKANPNREADCGEMHLYYIGQNADFVKDGVHKFIGTYASAPALTLTNEVPVADIKGATFTSGSSALTFTNPNGLVFANAAAQVNSTTKNVVVNGTCSSLQLEKGHPFINPTEFTATAATYSMVAGELAGGSFATLMIPFNATTLPGTAYALNNGVDLMSGTLRGTETTITANKPVLVTASGNYTGSSVTVPAVASGTTFDNGELVGTYSPMTAVEGSYVLQNHTSGEGVAFYLVGNTKPTVNPFRAYIKPQSSNARAIKVVFGDETEGIDSLTPSPIPADAPTHSLSPKGEGSVYTLSGQRVAQPTKGLYIVNGKKMIK